MPISTFPFEVKQLDQEGNFEGWAATYSNIDQGADICMPGCFAATLAAGKQRPLLLSHREPIGIVDLSDRPQGLFAKGKLTLAVQAARETYALMKDSVIGGMSIGYLTVKEAFVGGIRQLVELKVYEVSLTALPMNEMAVVTSVKTAQQNQIRIALKDFRTEILGALIETRKRGNTGY
jgi:Escherichia/Staphylococcus phage prohead protease